MAPTSAQTRISQRADEYRAQLARTLHEVTQQQLVNILLYLQRIDRNRPQGTNDPQPELESAVAETRSALEHLRAIVSQIYPAILATAGLAAALESLALRLPFPLEMDIDPTTVSTELGRTAYFVCAEFLGLLVGGAAADSARIVTTNNDDLLTIEIEHFGGRSLGNLDMTAIEDRILAAGGQLDRTTTAIGTPRMVARIPLFP